MLLFLLLPQLALRIHIAQNVGGVQLVNIGLPVRRSDHERARFREECATRVAIHEVRVAHRAVLLGLTVRNQVGTHQIIV